MAYNMSTGNRTLGDIKFEEDADTGIDFGQDTVTLETNGQQRLVVSNTNTLFNTPIRTTSIEYTDGDDAITIDDGGYLKFHSGVKYSRGVLVDSSSSPGNAGGWIKFATFNCPGASSLDTAASSFLITFAGMESSGNRRIDGIFMVHAKFTVNTGGSGTDGESVTNAYYEPEGTRISCEPLNAEFMSATGATDFDPATDLLMIFTNSNSTPVVDLYIKCNAKSKRCFVTHLGGTGQTDTSDTDIGWDINTGQSWSSSEPTAPAGSVKITGTFVSKIFSKLGIATTSPISELDVAGKIAITAEVGTPSQPADGQGYLYSKTDGKLYWRSYDLAETDLTATGGGGGGSDVPENVITGSSSLSIASSNNRDTIIITPLSGDVTYTLPNPEANFKIKFLAGTNLDSHNIIFKTNQSSQKIFGLLYRISLGGDGDTGYDNDPKSYNGADVTKFAGQASEVHKNTITIDNALQGSEIDFYSDGVYWYVKGEIVATIAGISLSATITFTSGSY